ncbi:MAG: hypothetical protein EZS28_031506 [Streblomastix strix]|uniref:Uncharacterized protein n=1 Tax=Streblomastix strix TaxID=222440 RepID=A0A5J4URF3_9EUKA|nr:MAG: hypothetical protein EZS28_031506 [Streblomastix strix]
MEIALIPMPLQLNVCKMLLQDSSRNMQKSYEQKNAKKKDFRLLLAMSKKRVQGASKLVLCGEKDKSDSNLKNAQEETDKKHKEVSNLQLKVANQQ